MASRILTRLADALRALDGEVSHAAVTQPVAARDSTREYRNFLETCETEASGSFDKTAVTLSGGALGISLAFLKDVVPEPTPWTILALLAPAWVALTSSVLGVLLSLMASAKSMRYEIECLDGRRSKPAGELAGGAWRTWTNVFNNLSLWGCIIGILCLTAFVVVNTWSKSMANSEAPKTQDRAERPASRRDNEGPLLQKGRLTPDRPAAPAAPPSTPQPPDQK